MKQLLSKSSLVTMVQIRTTRIPADKDIDRSVPTDEPVRVIDLEGITIQSGIVNLAPALMPDIVKISADIIEMKKLVKQVLNKLVIDIPKEVLAVPTAIKIPNRGVHKLVNKQWVDNVKWEDIKWEDIKSGDVIWLGYIPNKSNQITVFTAQSRPGFPLLFDDTDGMPCVRINPYDTGHFFLRKDTSYFCHKTWETAFQENKTDCKVV